MNTPKFSIVSPVYGAEDCIEELCARLIKTLEDFNEDFEIILVEDNSPDDSWSKIMKMGAADSRIKGVKLSRNFGQHYAISAGLKYAKGEWVVVMDCDLQDIPEEIPNLYNKATEGYEIVLARRTSRQDSFFKKLFSKYFYGVLGYLSGMKLNHEIANFGIYNRQVISEINKMPEKIKFFPTMINWVGFNKTAIPVKHGKREVGQSSYNFIKLMRLAVDIILANSDKPMRLMLKLGFIVFLTSLVFAVYTLILALTGQINVIGYSSLIISIWLFSGLIIFMLGLTGLYIGKVFGEVKDRPVYIVRQTINF